MDCSRVRTLVHRFVSVAGGRAGGPGDSADPTAPRLGPCGPAHDAGRPGGRAGAGLGRGVCC